MGQWSLTQNCLFVLLALTADTFLDSGHFMWYPQVFSHNCRCDTASKGSMDAALLEELRKISAGQKKLANSVVELGGRVSCLEDVQRSQSATSDTDMQTLLQQLQDKSGQLSTTPSGSDNTPAADPSFQSSQLFVASLLHTQVGLPAVGDTLQEESRVLQDVYSKVHLPSDLRFQGQTRGLQTECREQAAILHKAARYAEVGLKILVDILRQSSDNNYRVNEHLDELMQCFVAQLRYLQEEQSSLFAKGSFGSKTHSLFRQFQCNTTLLGTDDIEVLHAAVTLALIPPESHQSGPNRGRGGFQGSFCGCGFRG